ncbi:DUF2332 domain-containing protein [Plastoroseomonas hellenica]|uniref:DUF2332 domain-containing protein n=1 Tax=Plastoroseomonas hellenica TaxID=2687306 RepID=UPI001BA7DB57|nr:DUF2332 domain-containing protein [Plastoroseomonas hellenica]MBR0643865.1 DUF2332 domain-containing protein [Plastoroseomonas hellenica]
MADATSADTARRYRRFAEQEARGRSPLYEALSLGVAEDPDILRFLLTLPEAKRQPNLLLAAARHLFGTPSGWEEFRRNILDRPEDLRALMLVLMTQTNEPARCASLLPVLARLPQPLALIEVGASAGLCLLPDRYGYDYGRAALPAPAGGPVFPCAVNAAVPLPAAVPQVVWRAGLDLNPLDIADPEERAWLETLVWPEQRERLARLRAAMAIAAVARPRVVRGDLRRDLARLAAEAPREATLVIFHTAVLSYLPSLAEREGFAADVGGFCRYWIANEAPSVLPAIAARAGEAPTGRFLLSVNGAPLAWTDPHGAALDWIDGAS